MLRTYLLAAVVLCVCLSAPAQSPKEKISPVSAAPAVIANAPTNIAPEAKADEDRSLTNQDRDLSFQFTPLDLNSDRAILISPDGLGLDGVCYAIRSYVVARDSRTSESTHLVHTSTCQPASRYRFKSVQAQPAAPSH